MKVEFISNCIYTNNNNYEFEIKRQQKTNQKLALENCSIYKASSVKGQICKSPWDGYILPKKEIHYRCRQSVTKFGKINPTIKNKTKNNLIFKQRKLS